MNVTYLIGNGFDLGIGLHTDFKSFLNYYVDVPSPTAEIAGFKKIIRHDTIELWADFEKCFGEYISNFDDETIDDYVKLYEDVLNELNNYLNTENDRFSDDISKEEEQQIIKWILLEELDRLGFRPALIESLYSVTGYHFPNVNTTYNFLLFNYTSTFDKIITRVHDISNGILKLSTFNNVEFMREIGSVIHVHGNLNKNIIMGVNDVKQLPFLGDLPDRIKRRVIKPEKNKRMGYNYDKDAANFINNSTIICIYGMSIGETDTIWWERIGEWLLRGEKKKLIYFVYDQDVKDETVYSIDQIIDAEEIYYEKLLNSLNVSKEQWKDAKERIIVIINSEFMQMNKTKELSTVQG